MEIHNGNNSNLQHVHLGDAVTVGPQQYNVRMKKEENKYEQI